MAIGKYFWVVMILLLIFATEACAVQVLRCKDGKEIRTGDSTYSVLKRCGQPAYQEVVSAEGCDKVEKWYYDCQGRRFTDVLVFKAGVLTKHRQGDKTTGTQLCK